MNISEFNNKYIAYRIKYDPDINLYTLERNVNLSEWLPQFQWNINGIKAVDGHDSIPLDIFDNFIEVYKITRELDIMIPLPIFAIDHRNCYRELDEDAVTEMLGEFGYEADDIYIEQQFDDDDICYVMIYLNRDKDFNKLRLFLECMFNSSINRRDILHWDIHNSDDLVRPFITMEYRYSWVIKNGIKIF